MRSKWYKFTNLQDQFCGRVLLWQHSSHWDNAAEFFGEAWTVVIPLNVVNNSPPELVIENPHSKKAIFVKYESPRELSDICK